MTNNIFTDGERSTTWGVNNASREILEETGVPYCFNPENGKAVLLFDGRRRISSILHIFKDTKVEFPQIIRSKKAIIPFLGVGDFEVYPLQYGFGLSFERLVGESYKSVEIARIIAEFKLETLKDLNNYILKERPDLYDELTRRYPYYQKIIDNFEGTNQLKTINDTLKNGFYMICQTNQKKSDK